MKKWITGCCIGIFVLMHNAFAQNSDEPLYQEYKKHFKKEYFSVGALMQFVFDYQGERTQPGNNGFVIANLRLKSYGKFDSGFGYFFQMKFNSAPAILDAYMTYQISPMVILQMGQFKSPFSREYLTSAAAIDFVNRSRVVTALAPGRQIGLQIGGFLTNKVINYSVSIFNGNSPRQNDNDNSDFLYACRIALIPKWFENKEGSGLELGLNTAYSHDKNVDLVSGLMRAFSGDRMLIGSDIRIQYKKLLLAGEFIRANLEPVAGTQTTPQGFHTTVGYMVLPRVRFLLRWDQLDPDQLDASDSPSNWIVVGMNFWPTGTTEFQLNYIVDPDESDLDHHQILANAQIAF